MRSTWFAVSLLALAACAPTTQILTGTTRPPISPAEVKIYSHAPAAYEEIAVLTATSKSVFTSGGQKSIDKVVERLKEQAAKLGANGLILEDFSDSQTGSIGTGVGSESYSRGGSVGVGVGGAVGIFKKTGRGRAIFIPPS
jgi:uncharacterized protein YbjQ (UPF0145 family)